MNEEWFKGWKVINNTNDEYIIRREIDRMLEVFYNEGPWFIYISNLTSMV